MALPATALPHMQRYTSPASSPMTRTPFFVSLPVGCLSLFLFCQKPLPLTCTTLPCRHAAAWRTTLHLLPYPLPLALYCFTWARRAPREGGHAPYNSPTTLPPENTHERATGARRAARWASPTDCVTPAAPDATYLLTPAYGCLNVAWWFNHILGYAIYQCILP